MSNETNERIAVAWRDMRRSATSALVLAEMLGPNDTTLDPGQLDALEVLATQLDHGWQMGAFAEALRVERSTATRAVDRLVALQLAERARDPDDRRVVRVRATMRGAAAARRAHRRRTLGVGRILEQFTETERTQLANYLDRFVASLDLLIDETPSRDTPLN